LRKEREGIPRGIPSTNYQLPITNYQFGFLKAIAGTSAASCTFATVLCDLRGSNLQAVLTAKDREGLHKGREDPQTGHPTPIQNSKFKI
jgi:hypothetical protein